MTRDVLPSIRKTGRVDLPWFDHGTEKDTMRRPSRAFSASLEAGVREKTTAKFRGPEMIYMAQRGPPGAAPESLSWADSSTSGNVLYVNVFNVLTAMTWGLIKRQPGVTRSNTRGLPMTISFAASRSLLSIRVGRHEVFAQRETAPAARYGVTREGRGAGILDLPGWSVSWSASAV